MESPFFLDFFHDFASLGSGYPPCNFIKKDDNHYVIEMAVAGFGKNSLDIEMDNGNLRITGKIQSETADPNYLFKGVANRSFNKQFQLASDVEVKDVELINGMLKLYLERLSDLSNPMKVNIR
jgi:molecular chaperone IbpA